MGRGTLLLVTGSLLTAPSMAGTDDGSASKELARCAAIAASQTRLACYDTLAGRTPNERQLAIEPAAAAPLTSPPPAAATPAETAQNFGLPATRLRAASQELPAIEAHIIQVRLDQFRRASVVLDNDQVWDLTEGEVWLNVGEAVTIKRAALGSFVLTSASKHSYRARRVR